MNIKDWAEFYFNKGVNVIPDNEHSDWVDWRHKKQSFEELRGYDWASAKDIYAVVGKKGIRVLSILRVENESIDLRNLLVERALSLLGLPYDYPWVIDYCDAICVIVESADDIQGMKNQKYRDIELLWQDTLVLPIGGSVHFYYGEQPKQRPTHVSNDLLLKCFYAMRKDGMGETDWPYFCGQIRPENLPILDSFNCLSLASKYDDADKILLGNWYLSCDTGLYRILFKDNGNATERTGTQWRSIVNGKWSFTKETTKKGLNKYYLHIKGGISKTFDIVYIDERIIYAHQVNNDSKSFFVRDAFVDSFRNNDDVVSYLSQIENRGKLIEKDSRNHPGKKSGCLTVFGIIALILAISLV